MICPFKSFRKINHFNKFKKIHRFHKLLFYLCYHVFNRIPSCMCVLIMNEIM